MKRLLTIFTFILALATASAGAQEKEGFVKHIVKWFESLESIANSYGVPADILVKINDLKEPAVRCRQTIYIPTDEKYWNTAGSDAQKGKEENATANSLSQAGGQFVPEVAVPVVPHPVQTVHFTLLLPMHSDNGRDNDNNLDFYSGVLMAVKKLAEEGTNVVVDAKEPGEFNVGALKKTDYVIGPIKSSEISETLQEIEDSTLVISPLDPKAEVFTQTHSNFVQSPVDNATLLASVAQWAAEIRDKANFIVLTSEMDTIALNESRKVLDTLGISYKVGVCGVQAEISDWSVLYDPEGINKVILAINNEAILNNAIRFLGTVKGNMEVFANSKVRSFNTIPVDNIHHARINAPCAYYVDYEDEQTKAFVLTYRSLFRTEPSQFAFQGYDLAYYMAKTYAKYGKNWRYLIEEEPQMNLLQTSFKMARVKDGGLRNTAVRRVSYADNYSILLQK